MRLSLEPAIRWKYDTSNLQGGLVVIPSAGDGRPAMLAQNELGRIVFLSAADGSVVTTFPVTDGHLRSFVDVENLQGDLGCLV